MDIIYLLIILWRKKWIIISLSVFSVLLAFFFTEGLPEEYKSTAQISTGFTTQEGIVISDERVNLREAELKFSNLLSMMRSGIVYNLLAYRLILHDLDSSKTPFRNLNIDQENKISAEELEKAKRIFNEELNELSPLIISEENADLQFKIVRSFGYTYPWIKESINIRRLPNTDYVVIEFFSENPHLSAFAANAYCKEFLRYYFDSKVKSSDESVEFYETLVSRKKQELEEKSKALKNFKENNQVLDINALGESSISEISELERQKSEVSSKIYGLNLKIRNLEENLNNLDDPSSNEGNNQKILALRQKINNLNQRLLNSGLNNQELQDSISLLREQLRYELSRVNSFASQTTEDNDRKEILSEIRDTELELEVEQSKLNQINYKLSSLKGQLSTYASKEATLSELEREVSVASNEYLSAMNKLNEAKDQLMASTGSIRQTAEAFPAANPEPTKRLIIIGFSGIATFSLCVFVFILIEIFDNRIKTPSQFERMTELKLAGSLIKVDVKKLNYPELFTHKVKDKQLESFKHFLRKIRFEIEATDSKTYLITSPKTGEGKSFTIFALAFVLSMINRKVLIIDTNFKNNTLTRWLSEQTKNIKLLESRRSTNLVLHKVSHTENSKRVEGSDDLVSPTKYRNIFIIGNGGELESPEEIFYGKDFSSLMEFLKMEFDHIILEGPSLNEFSDTKELIQYVDKVIPVFSAESSFKQLDEETLGYLKSLKNRLDGAILNKVDPRDLKI